MSDLANERVISKFCIRQSPLSNDPDVPKGVFGFVQDFVDDYYFVDFGDVHGVVCCSREEIRAA